MEVLEVSERVADLSLGSPKPVAGSSGQNIYESEDSDEDFKNYPEPYMGQIPLTKEHKKAIFEILRCAVCIEIPKPKPNLQVKSCENGHHFCSSCHDKLLSCAICRGKLLAGRNFVVEELISKMGKPLGIIRHMPQHTEPPLPIPKGQFQCPHCSDVKTLPAKRMLLHMRHTHKDQLVDNLRTNPYTGWFYAKIELGPGSKRRVCSFQVSDIGLMSVTVVTGETFQAWLQVLGNLDRHKVIYRMNITNKERVTRGVTDVKVLPYSTTHTPELPDYCTFPIASHATENVEISFLVQRSESAAVPSGWPFFSFDSSFHPNDRASRRNRARNRRRRRGRQRHMEAFEEVTRRRSQE